MLNTPLVLQKKSFPVTLKREGPPQKGNQDREKHCFAFYLLKHVCFYMCFTKSMKAETISYLLLYLQYLELYLENIQHIVIDCLTLRFLAGDRCSFLGGWMNEQVTESMSG